MLRIAPSAISGDAEFLRRITIDTIGSLPSPGEVRSFLADADPAKRAKAIDRLLAHPLHAALWATRFCDITGCNVEAMAGPPELQSKRAKMWHDWFRRRVARDEPYDQIVRGVLCATSREGIEGNPGRDKLRAQGVALPAGFTLQDLDDRDRLRRRFDAGLAGLDRSDLGSGLGRFQQQALDVIRSNRVRDALDLDREPPGLRDEYGRTPLGQAHWRPAAWSRPESGSSPSLSVAGIPTGTTSAPCVTGSCRRWTSR